MKKQFTQPDSRSPYFMRVTRNTSLSAYQLLTGTYSLLIILLLILQSTSANSQSSQSASGMTYANVAIAGSTTQWTGVTNVASSNNVYATPVADLPNPGDYSDYLRVTNFNFSIPPGSTVTGIKVNVERSDSHGKAKDSGIRIVKGGNIKTQDKSVSSSWHTSDDVEIYGGSSDLWGETWTYSDINSTGFGFAISARRQGGGSATTLAQIDEITITIYFNPPVTLPVEFLSFTAVNNDNNVELNWTTASEANSDYFAVEKSADAKTFAELETVKAAGNSTVKQSYQIIDYRPATGIAYYRLRQVDYNKEVTYSKIAVINRQQKSEILVVPNPVKSNRINIMLPGTPVNSCRIYIIDRTGKTVYYKKISPEFFNKSIRISDLHLASSGLYNMNVEADGIIYHEKISAFSE